MPISFDDNNDVILSGGTDQTSIGNSGDRLKVETLDVSNGTGTQGALTVGTSAVEVKVGASRLTDRRYITIFNNGNQTIYWGRTSGVTTSSGTPIFKKQMLTFRAGDAATIYLISGSAGQNVRVTENA